ncbi:DUF5719 family protein [Streptomyces hainanensis]|nr:DUF5719 family protein [Streptomyces hainanensis]
MNRATMSLLAGIAVLAALTGVAALRPADDVQITTLELSSPRPVERSALTCPRPTASEGATTWYTAFTPPPLSPGFEQDETGSAALLPAPEHSAGSVVDDDSDEEPPAESDPVVPLEEAGAPVTVTVTDSDAPALTGTAEAGLAPGWTVQQTTRVETGNGRGLLGTACQTPDTEFWFAGASTAESRGDYVHITNPDAAATVVDIELFGPEGRIETDTAEGFTVPGGTTVPVRVSTLTDEAVGDLAVHVTARTGRIGAQIEAVDAQRGADWLTPSTAAAGGPVVLPGIPAAATGVRLVAFAPGDDDITLEVGLAGPGGTITPAGFETVALRSGELTALDLGNLTQGEASSVVLTPAGGSGSGRVVAALQVVGGEEDAAEMAFIPATSAVEERATVSGNTTSGTTLALTAPGDAAEVSVTISAGTEGGEPVTETYTVDGATTLTVTPELPDGTGGSYAITVQPGGGGPLFAARTLTMGDEDARVFTVQTLPDDQSAVEVPDARQDLSVLLD